MGLSEIVVCLGLLARVDTVESAPIVTPEWVNPASPMVDSVYQLDVGAQHLTAQCWARLEMPTELAWKRVQTSDMGKVSYHYVMWVRCEPLPAMW